MGSNIVVLDNGACYAKIGLSSQTEPKVIPNCIMKAKSERRRPFVGDQIEDCRDASGLFYILPFQKGYLINWDVQKNVWDYIFSKECCDYNISEMNVIVTEPFFNFPTIQEAMTEIFFEEFACTSLLRINSQSLSSYNYSSNNSEALCCVVVDSGYSFTHVAPYIKNKKVANAIRRIDVGGKLLTNHLKDIISYRQLHVMDETYVINQVKEDSCFVSQDFMKDMAIASKKGPQNVIMREYVLPDYTTIRRGYLCGPGERGEDHQCLRLNNERFSVPETLFHPTDIGINQMGIPETIIHSILSCPPETHPHLFSNIVVTGGSTLFPGFRDRVEKEIRALAPDHFDVRVTMPEDPIQYAWKGGALLANSESFSEMTVSRKDYEEKGYAIVEEKFDV
ncbi:hypothetical protein RUM44_009839 [Polyplax serrata]|uniref:Actin-related protein 6 n=1 Tax=Polyplax serrata TaxID=468196 RepID=A0ABR1AVJ5_POLSC